MQKMDRTVVHSEDIRLAHSFRRNATMLTHYNVCLVQFTDVIPVLKPLRNGIGMEWNVNEEWEYGRNEGIENRQEFKNLILHKNITCFCSYDPYLVIELLINWLLNYQMYGWWPLVAVTIEFWVTSDSNLSTIDSTLSTVDSVLAIITTLCNRTI